MRRLLLLSAPILLAAGLSGGCSKSASHAASEANAVAGAPITATLASLAGASHAGGFAALADHGDLVAYPAQRVVRKETASTWYRADVSEAHAMRSIVTGEMTITAPDGQPIRLRYERHVEHPNGNWTWIGRDANGEDAVLTFGEKAVFGSIPQKGRDELRLATIGGHSWMVQADPGKQNHPDSRKADYLVPPELAASLASADAATASEPVQAQAASATAATTTVDVALGYTTGFATELGGDSQAVTRLQNLVDITNQAYANSQINAQVRLVRTVSVNYPDATSNDDTLTKLSGYKSGTGVVAPDAAFSTLRAARDQYGADLVSLVRRFRTPENAGCGLAWLIGGGQTSIDNSDAYFGYSVVSDDLDKGDLDETDNKTYVCRKETLAHEFGHNMGQQHNVEDSGGDAGAHVYSYGYREASTTGFYTVMAYRLANSSQRNVRYFANPNVTEALSGRPTGVANSSDNARSMTQTMPLIAAFRATVVIEPSPQSMQVGPAEDVDADGRADFLWFNPSTRELYYWLMDGAAIRLGQGGVFAPANTTPRALADFNADGRADLVLASGSDIWIYLGNSSGTFNSAYVAVYPAGWNLAGAADIDADGKSDLVWYNPTTRELYYWLMNGGSIRLGRGGVLAPANTTPRAMADFNRDGRADIMLASAGDIWIYLGNASGTFNSAYVASYPVGWNFAGASDIDADGVPDLVWHNPSTRELYYWLMDGGSIRLGRGGVLAPPGTTPRSLGDFDLDGRADIVLASSSDIWMYRGNSQGTFTSAYVATYPVGWNLL